MKIAIHHREGSFSSHWIDYCQRNGIDFKLVNAYDNDIVSQLADCNIFMWHHHQSIYKDQLLANHLLLSMQGMGLITYPNLNTSWHFDDKLAQHYLLNSIGAPIVPTYIFFNKQDAIEWAEQTTFPKVFKLKNGSSSANVMLVKNSKQAQRLISKAFNKGIPTFRYKDRIKERYRLYKIGKVSLRNLLGLVRRALFRVCPGEYFKFHDKECGYVYFQDFMSSKNFDIRVLVIGNKAIAKKRINRPNDFRASGGNNLIFDKEQIDEKFVQAAFLANKSLKMQSVAFDFLYGKNDEPLISEISYCCGYESNKDAPGYWTSDMQWHKCSNINICDWIIEEVIAEYKAKESAKVIAD